MNRQNEPYDARQYAKSKKLPFREAVEWHTIRKLLGEVAGLSVVDAGCGDGIYSRRLIDLGAESVIGIDGSQDFIDLAVNKGKGYLKKVQYGCSLIQDSQGDGTNRLVVGSYILSYPRSLEEAIRYCQAIASHLKTGGRFVGFNNNPFQTFEGLEGGDYLKYGFLKQMHGDREGSEVLYLLEGMSDIITNYYLSPETYQEAFKQAGFREFNWVPIELDPEVQDKEFWKDFFAGQPPFIAMTAVKG